MSRIASTLRRLREEGGWGRVWTTLGMAIALAGGGLVYQQVLDSPAVGVQVWVTTSGNDGTCARGNEALPCATFDKAAQIAQAGDTVSVAAGTYSQQTVDESKASTVTFQASGTVTVNTGIYVDPPAAHLSFNGLTTPYLSVGGTCSNSEAACGTRATNIAFSDTRITGYFDFTYVNGVTLTGGTVGPDISTIYTPHPLVGHNHGGSVTDWEPQNVTIDDVHFQNITQPVKDATHTECLLVWSVDGLVVENSDFYKCGSTGPVYITRLNVGDLNSAVECKNVTVQDNMFQGVEPDADPNSDGWDYPQVESDCQNMTISHNTFAGISQLYLLEDSPSYTVSVTGNHGNYPAGPGCRSGGPFAMSGNDWPDNYCG